MYLSDGAVEVEANQRGDVGDGDRRRVSGDDRSVRIARLRHDQHLVVRRKSQLRWKWSTNFF